MARVTSSPRSWAWLPIEPDDRPHAVRLFIIWVILSILGVLGVLFGIHYPPYDNSIQGTDQSRTLAILTAMATPVFIGVVLMLLYSAIYFRRTTTQLVDGAPMYGNSPAQIAWIVISSIMVLFAAFIGITTLANNNVAQFVGAPGRALAGGSSSSSGAAAGSNQVLNVQVVAQEWYFTYRYPDYGGVETTHLELPVNRAIELHVTSLDVIHSFWAYELGVKADANQGIDNTFYVTPTKITSFQIRCAELCGLWHGSMFDTGQVVSQSDFDSWISQQQQDYSAIQKAMPSYAPVYYPAPSVKGS